MLRKLIEQILAPKGWDTSERRRAPRAKLCIAAEVILPFINCHGTVLEIGPSGMKIQVNAHNLPALAKGMPVEICHQPPEGCPVNTIHCELRWSRRSHDHYATIGVTYTDSQETLGRSWVPVVLAEALQSLPNRNRKILRARTAIETSFVTGGAHGSGVVVDLSVGGAMLETALPLKRGDQLDLTLKFLPPHKPVQLRGKVRRCPAQGEGDEYGLSLELSDQDKLFLQDLIRALIAVQHEPGQSP